MDGLQHLQRQIRQLYLDRNYAASPSTLMLGVMEEVGELAMSLLLTECPDFKPAAKKLSPEWADARDSAREVGDTITYLLALCNALDIKPYFKWQNKDNLSLENVTLKP